MSDGGIYFFFLIFEQRKSVEMLFELKSYES